jgi:hypothetical protein
MLNCRSTRVDGPPASFNLSSIVDRRYRSIAVQPDKAQ